MELTAESVQITGKDIVNYWLGLFPEIENEDKLQELLHMIGELSLECLIDETMQRQQELVSVPHERFAALMDKPLAEYLITHADRLERYVPFCHFFLPVVSHELGPFQSRLAEMEIVEDPVLFTEHTVKHILDSLFELAYRVIVLEVNAARMSGQLKGATSQERLTYFADVLLKDKSYLLSIYEEYSTLIEVLSITTRNYFNFTLEVLHNTATEKMSLESVFFMKEPMGRVVKLDTGAGDGHKGGKAVSIMHFTSGSKLVYKPRSLELEIGFNELLHWLNNQAAKAGKVLDFRTSRVYSLQDCGWMEFIENEECPDYQALERFYVRSGQILCLLYVLNSVDFHFENLIASGEHPMLIDMESIFHAVAKGEKKEEHSGYIKARKVINSSVNMISLLPTVLSKRSGADEISFDLGGLSVHEEQTIPIKSLFIDGIETDLVKVLRQDSVITPKSNNPVFEGRIVSSEDYVRHLKDGFSQMYLWIMNHKREVEHKVKMIFSAMRSRLIMKATAFYGQLLKIAAHPDFMRYEADRRMILHRVALKASEVQKWIVSSEYEDLYQNDIPYFTVDINDTRVINSRGEACEDLLERSSMSAVLEKLESLSLGDLNRQNEFIEMSYFNKRTDEADLTGVQLGTGPRKLTPERWLQVAKEIGEHILDSSISGRNDAGNPDKFWISTSLQGFEENIWKPDVLGFDLYNGNAGIALFLGYLGKITGRADFKEAAFEAMEMPKSIMQTLEKDQPYSIGAFTGLPGIMYTLHKLADLYRDETSIDFINAHMDTLGQVLLKDEIHDVIGGAAGAMAVALSMYNTPNEKLKRASLKLAMASRDQLMRSARQQEEMIFWPSVGDKSYSGFSHGSAGIITYMHKLYTLCGDKEILADLGRALRFERSLFSAGDGNWFVSDRRDKVSHGWCHGAPGMLVSKLLLLKTGYSDSQLEQEIETAVHTTMKYGIGNNPTYCHGDLGNLAALRFAGELTGNHQLLNQSNMAYQELFDQVLSKEWNQKNMKSGWSLSLMIGITGFGYSMLRQYAPDVVPEFLWLE
ncbi:type 2 lanthipeptide synthetase LanM family protein [Paenibacillus tuaregi]|uniref:type 2 lanthipeptide synthetase LanM family protein n=1 Tax=Paenibacillus tuaregi TaxID=1816681 RepID=UPI0008394422|nr:type 2 lanthipeptide synthetase LanM family protein [Paenibacillus tuaregi]